MIPNDGEGIPNSDADGAAIPNAGDADGAVFSGCEKAFCFEGDSCGCCCPSPLILVRNATT